MQGAERNEGVTQSGIDFRQSYVLERISDSISDKVSSEQNLISQIDRIEAIRLQFEKFKTDLGGLPHQNPVIQKTMENLAHLEKDVGKLANQLGRIKGKFQDESSMLRERERQLADRIDGLKVEMSSTLSQLEVDDSRRMHLEQTVKNLSAAIKNTKKRE
jgi:DNA repair ATPase RecN